MALEVLETILIHALLFMLFMAFGLLVQSCIVPCGGRAFVYMLGPLAEMSISGAAIVWCLDRWSLIRAIRH